MKHICYITKILDRVLSLYLVDSLVFIVVIYKAWSFLYINTDSFLNNAKNDLLYCLIDMTVIAVKLYKESKKEYKNP